MSVKRFSFFTRAAATSQYCNLPKPIVAAKCTHWAVGTAEIWRQLQSQTHQWKKKEKNLFGLTFLS